MSLKYRVSITDVPSMNTDGASGIASNKHWFFHLWSHGRMGVTMATPQTLLSIRDVMAVQSMMRLGGGLRRRGAGALLGGETKTDLINHRVLRHRQTASRYRWSASPLVAIISVAVQEKWSMCVWGALCAPRIRRLDSFVFLKSRGNSGESEPFGLAVSLQSGSLMNLLWKIMYFSYIFFIDSSPQRLCQDFPLTSTLSWLPPCPSDVFLSSLPPQASLQIRPLSLSLPGSADCDAWLSVFSKSPLVSGSRPPLLAQTAIKTRSVAVQPAAWKWEDGEEREGWRESTKMGGGHVGSGWKPCEKEGWREGRRKVSRAQRRRE